MASFDAAERRNLDRHICMRCNARNSPTPTGAASAATRISARRRRNAARRRSVADRPSFLLQIASPSHRHERSVFRLRRRFDTRSHNTFGCCRFCDDGHNRSDDGSKTRRDRPRYGPARPNRPPDERVPTRHVAVRSRDRGGQRGDRRGPRPRTARRVRGRGRPLHRHRRRVRRRRLRALDRRLARRARPRALHDRLEGVLADPRRRPEQPRHEPQERPPPRRRPPRSARHRLPRRALHPPLGRRDAGPRADEDAQRARGVRQGPLPRRVDAPPERLEGRPRQRDRPQRRLGAVQRAPAAIQSRRPRDRRGVLEFARQQNLAVSPWSPLGQGS